MTNGYPLSQSPPGCPPPVVSPMLFRVGDDWVFSVGLVDNIGNPRDLTGAAVHARLYAPYPLDIAGSAGSITVTAALEGAPTDGCTYQHCMDCTAKLYWVRKVGDANWNGSATANPATGVGGLDISTINSGSPVALFFPLACVSSGTTGKITSSLRAAELSATPPAGFSAIGGA